MFNLATFIDAYFDVPNTGNTPENRGQCVGLVEVWISANKAPHIVGNAVDLLNNADPKSYIRILNNPTNYPFPGDVLCWNASWGSGFGHTAVVVAANGNRVGVFEQNDPDGSPPALATHDYSGVAGWLRFK